MRKQTVVSFCRVLGPPKVSALRAGKYSNGSDKTSRGAAISSWLGFHTIITYIK